jgi:hypothetical protein
MIGRIVCCLFFVFTSFALHAQVNVQSIPIRIANGTSIGIAGNLQSNQNILGDGKIELIGNTLQDIDLSGNAIPNLEINNSSGVNLLSNIKIDSNLQFSNGKININNNDLIFSETANITGGDEFKYITTNGAGKVIKFLNSNLTNFEIPIGNNNYRPVYLNTSGSYTNASVSLKSIDSSFSNKPLHIVDYLKNYWSVDQTGINGNLQVTAQFNNNIDVFGNADNINGYYFDGNEWSSANSSSNSSQHRITVPVSNSQGIISGMNAFVYLGSKAYLQGAYNNITGLMDDKLRTPVLYLPLTDPYSTPIYANNFQHVNHPISESIESSLLADQTNDSNNIVDWVFLELRNQNTIGNSILATRSALIQKDGDIVDTDGKSPVTFNYIPQGNYALSVRHRNHLALSLNPAYAMTLSENKSTAFTSNLIDLSTMPSNQVYGTSNGYALGTHPTLNNIRLMWGGNANGNNNIRYSGFLNDRAAILTDLNNNENNILTGYYRADVNMNGTVNYTDTISDKSFLIQNILNNSEIKIIQQELPQ